MKLSDDDLEMARGIYEMRIWSAFILGALGIIAAIVLFIMAPFQNGEEKISLFVVFGLILLVVCGCVFAYGFIYIVWPHIENRRNKKKECVKKTKEKDKIDY